MITSIDKGLYGRHKINIRNPLTVLLWRSDLPHMTLNS